jgi:Holliday junction DNA helicase RuvA
MITRVTGVLNRVLDDEVRLQVGPLEYQVLVPEFVRRQLQTRLGQEATLHTSEYLEGNQMSNRFVPRLIGFNAEAELEFFDLFCTVEKIGVRKALKALVRPVRDVADAVLRKDVKWLTTLPGVGTATAEQIITSLHKKVARYAVAAPAAAVNGTPAAAAAGSGDVLEDAYAALLSVGHNPLDARQKIDAVVARGQTFNSVEEVLVLIYRPGK